MKRIAIYGASGCGRVTMPLALRQFDDEINDFDLVFVDDNPSIDIANGYDVLNYHDWINLPATSRHINIAIANSRVREMLSMRCSLDGVKFLEVRANNVVQFNDVSIGEGAILAPFVTLTSNIKIGRHFQANLYSYVEHDCVIGDFVTFAPGVKCNGNVIIKDHVYVGSGAIIKQGSPGNPLVIGEGAVIGMGAVVTKSVEPGAVVIGNPARVMNK